MERQEVLLRAARLAIRPIVRQLLRHGVTFSAFVQAAKRVFFDVAATDFSLPGRPQTDSRIALLTGLTRRDVAALRAAKDQAVVELDPHLATRLIGTWSSDHAYCSASGTPRPLPLESNPGGGPSFGSLVRQVGGDIPPRAILDELIRVGSVELQATRTVRLLRGAYIPAADSPERVEMMGEDIGEFGAVIAHNLEAPPHDAFLQQKVVYDNIGDAGLPGLRAELRRLGAAFLRRVNKLLADGDRDRNPSAPGGARKRVVMGVYYFHADDEDAK